jgi:integrase
MDRGARRRDSGRAANNEGTIYQDANGVWHARLITGLDISGRPIRKHRQAQTEKEARKKLAELKTERDKRVPAEGRRKLLVADLIDEYVEYVLLRRESARDHYDDLRRIRNRLLPAFGSIPVKSFDVSHMDETYAQWMSDPKRPIKPATVRRIHAILSKAFTTAMKRRRIDFDPTKLVTLPTIIHEERDWLTVEEIELLLTTAEDQVDWVRWAIALNMGLRQGEVLGLRWRDFKPETREVMVEHSLNRRIIPQHACGGTCGRKKAGDCTSRFMHGCGETCGQSSARNCPLRVGEESLVLGSTKEHRQKLLPIPNEIFQALLEQRTRQEALRENAGSGWCDLDFIFTNDLGRPLDLRRDHDAWKALLRKAGLPACRLHDARHGTGSGLQAVGTTTTTIKDALGHSSTRVTERYVHTQPAGVRDGFEAFSKVIMPNRANKGEPPRTETETETGCALKNARRSRKPRNTGRNGSRLGDLNPGPTHYECVALPLS